MNTPTPAQALADVRTIHRACRPVINLSDIGYKEAAFLSASMKFFSMHGQHFAGLEAEVERLRETLVSVTRPDGSPNLHAEQSGAAESYRAAALHAIAQREAAEARCAELQVKYEEVVVKCSGAADRCHLLLDAKEHWRDRAGEAGILLDRVLTQVGKTITSDLNDDIAAFLAARG